MPGTLLRLREQLDRFDSDAPRDSLPRTKGAAMVAMAVITFVGVAALICFGVVSGIR